MQTKAKFRFRKATTPPTRHPGSDSDRAPRLIAAVGAVLITVLGMAALVSTAPAEPTHHASVNGPVHSINGIPVFDLPSVNVSASVSNQATGNDVASDARPFSFSNSLLHKLSNNAAPVTLIGAQFSMPYYSFGSQFGRVTKD